MTADQMMRAEIAKETRPKRSRWFIAASALGVLLLLVGAFFGIRALNDYRADIESMQESAAAYYQAAEDQAQLADAAADRAQSYAEAASDAVSVAEAEEQEAAAAAEAQIATNVANGLTPEGKCPSGTVAGAVDENGIESACSPTNGQGQQCVAYNDANQCTQWYRP